MTLNEYQQAALETANYPQEYNNLLGTTNDWEEA